MCVCVLLRDGKREFCNKQIEYRAYNVKDKKLLVVPEMETAVCFVADSN